MTPSMQHHQPPFWISEASWKAPPRVCFCVSFSKYCSLSLHFLMLCLLSGTSKAAWSKMAQCGEPAVSGALPPYIPRQDPANFPDLAKVLRDLVMKGLCPGHVLSLSCLGPKSIVWKSMATIWTECTFGVTPASLVDRCSKHVLMYTTSNNQVLSLQMLFKVYHTRWRQHLMCISVSLLFGFLGLFVNPCPSLSDLFTALSYVSSQVSSNKGLSPSSYKSLDHFKAWH